MNKRKPYIKEKDKMWWTKKSVFIKYMIREGVGIPIAIYSIILILGISWFGQGRDAYDVWLNFLQTPFSKVLHGFLLVGALYHTYTWFAIAPKAFHIIVREQRLANWVITLVHYIMAIASSVLLYSLIMWV